MEGESEPATVLPMSHHQDRSVHFEDSQSHFFIPRFSEAPDILSTKTSLSWRPVYLRRIVLFSFITIFILNIVTIESLLAVLSKNNGIATANSTDHYLWTYGPTAFFTGIAALWGRTEYQSKLVAPWIRLSKNRRLKQTVSASRTLLLDYVSQFSLFAIFYSLRNRDFIVFVALTVSIIIKILVVLSSGLISLELTNITQDSYPMVLETSFVDSNARLARTSELAWYILTGLESLNLTVLEGISREYAFQSPRMNLSDVAETRVITDGLRSSLQCEPVQLNLTGTQFQGLITPGLFVNISSTDYNVISLAIQGMDLVEPENNSKFLGAFQRIQCDSIEGVDGRRIAVLFAQSSLNTSHDYTFWNGEVHPPVEINSTQLLCIPTYAIDRVQVIQNGTQTTVVPVQGTPSRMLNSVTAWDIMDAHFTAAGWGDTEVDGLYQSTAGSAADSTIPLYADNLFDTALKYCFAPDSPAVVLFDSTVLQRTFEVYYRQISAIVSKTSLMEPAVENVFGSVTFARTVF
ncbi:hypothetical protein E0Z10_g6379 [Xylaria hypoxylon]|uniref:Uncharacterized protein n=1 Tax=Xylaria hypoxylon TaxID=37992 RepID=A0A4Z0YYE9_9PEZI|nr:hypothetical protein E0Z10_g6379 [Xylaria hypoxylon]